MTIKEAENFYKQDKKEYNLTKNTVTKNWLNDLIEREKLKLNQVKYPENYGKALKSSLKRIYESIKDIKDLQKLIDFITTWYEIKYPDKELDKGTIYLRYENIKSLSIEMNIEQLLYKLNDQEEDLVSCYYRARSWSSTPIIINNKIVRNDSIHVTLKIKNETNNMNNDFFLSINIDYNTGLIPLNQTIKHYLKDYIKEKDIKRDCIHIEELIDRLEKDKDTKVDYLELLETVLDRKLRLKIRKEILELASLKILYSENTIPEYGYERAKRFINEMNKKLNANLSTDRINEIMNRNYKESIKLVKRNKQ